MKRISALLARLDEIGRSIADSGHGLAVIGLGSVGLETRRLDEYSDLDFFVIVEPEWKSAYIENLDWLNRIAPLAYQFRNTADGHKVMFEDGIFCEFAVFELAELPRIPFAPGRIVWKREEVDAAIASPVIATPSRSERNQDWLLGEALTNLYVGMCRYCRGEKLSASRFVQQYAVDRILEIIDTSATGDSSVQDPFAPDRRLEFRRQEIALQLPVFIQGYDHTPEAAEAILDFLENHYTLNKPLCNEIRRLCRVGLSKHRGSDE